MMSAHVPSNADGITRAPECPICHRPLTLEETPELTPHSCEMTEDNQVKLGFVAANGEVVYATMSSTALLQFVSMAMQAVNSHTAQFLMNLPTTPL
jgi:UDP:flavonoid glycosyltransferase YjiC (YdhE family)